MKKQDTLYSNKEIQAGHIARMKKQDTLYSNKEIQAGHTARMKNKIHCTATWKQAGHTARMKNEDGPSSTQRGNPGEGTDPKDDHDEGGRTVLDRRREPPGTRQNQIDGGNHLEQDRIR